MGISRLDRMLRKRIAALYVRIMCKNNPSLRQHILKALKLVSEGKAPKASVNHIITSYVGKYHAKKILDVAMTRVIEVAIQERTLYDQTIHEPSQICHACFSYMVQCSCPSCCKLTFCTGCIDYGSCTQCS